MRLQDIAIKNKLLVLVTLMILSMVISCAYTLKLSHDDIIESRKTMIKNIVDSTVSQLKHILTEPDTVLSKSEKERYLKEFIYSVRYDSNNYMMIHDITGKMLLHPIMPELENRNLIDFQDSAGNYPTRLMLQGIREKGESFWYFKWPHPGEEKAVDKLSYAKIIPGTELILATGVYMDDITDAFITRTLLYTVITLFFAYLCFLVASRIAASISAPTVRLTQQLQKLTSGNISVEVTDGDRKDELGSIARALIHFKQQTLENIHLKQQNEEARYRESFDPNTQLMTRKAIGAALQTALNERIESQLIAIFVIKIPILRDILSQWGNEFCNAALADISQRIRAILPKGDLLARHGDDSITLVQLNTTTERVHHAITSIQDIIMQPANISGQKLTFISRIGISFAPENGDQELQLISNAEEALSEARRLEFDYMYFNQLKTFALDERLELWKDIQKALVEDQFHLVFQPLFDLQTNRLISAEVLLRWAHPEKGLISPAKFVTFAEQSGLVTRLDRWVLEATAKQIFEWHQQGLEHPPLAINLSGLTFVRCDLQELVRSVTAIYDIPLSMIEFELTEGVLIESIETVQNKINSLKSLGIKTSIDDFGTGYSSLSRIRNLPIDKVKIDRAFIEDLESSHGDKQIISAITHMAQGLGFKVVAEGVETLEQLNILRIMNCNIVQGYLLSKPLEKNRFELLLENQNLEIELD